MQRSRFVTLNCLLLDSDAVKTVQDASSLPVGRWEILACIARGGAHTRYDTSVITWLQEGYTTWTHLAIVMSSVAETHSDVVPSELENPWLSTFVKKNAGDRNVIDVNGNIGEITGFTRNTLSSWAFLKSALDEASYLKIRDAVLSAMDHVRSPYPVIEKIGIYSYSAETAVVWYKDRKAVCKLFRSGFEPHWKSEVQGLAIASRLGIGPRILDTGPTWVLMEYLDGFQPIRAGWTGYYPLRETRRALRKLMELHEAGLAMFDFNPNNVLCDKEGRVRVIDYADSFLYQDIIPPFDHSPFVSGLQCLDYYDVEADPDDFRLSYYRKHGPGATYEHHWFPRVGVSLSTVLKDSSKHRFKRVNYFFNAKLPRAIRQRL